MVLERDVLTLRITGEVNANRHCAASRGRFNFMVPRAALPGTPL